MQYDLAKEKKKEKKLNNVVQKTQISFYFKKKKRKPTHLIKNRISSTFIYIDKT